MDVRLREGGQDGRAGAKEIPRQRHDQKDRQGFDGEGRWVLQRERRGHKEAVGKAPMRETLAAHTVAGKGLMQQKDGVYYMCPEKGVARMEW